VRLSHQYPEFLIDDAQPLPTADHTPGVGKAHVNLVTDDFVFARITREVHCINANTWGYNPEYRAQPSQQRARHIFGKPKRERALRGGGFEDRRIVNSLLDLLECKTCRAGDLQRSPGRLHSTG
jgi:hypothetical protein